MANEKNLKPVRTTSEARERGRNGGKASGKARRKRKALRQSMCDLLELPVHNARDFNKLSAMGLDMEDIDNSQLLVLALFNQAKKGDVAAFKEIRGLIGEASDDSKLDKLDELLEEFRNATK